MKPMTDWITSQNGTFVIETLPSWFAFFTKYVLNEEAVRTFLALLELEKKLKLPDHFQPVGTPILLGSRLIPKSVFETPEGRSTMVDILLQMAQHRLPYIPVVPPILFNATEGSTSTTPAWRDALWHVRSNHTYYLLALC